MVSVNALKRTLPQAIKSVPRTAVKEFTEELTKTAKISLAGAITILAAYGITALVRPEWKKKVDQFLVDLVKRINEKQSLIKFIEDESGKIGVKIAKVENVKTIRPEVLVVIAVIVLATVAALVGATGIRLAKNEIAIYVVSAIGIISGVIVAITKGKEKVKELPEDWYKDKKVASAVVALGIAIGFATVVVAKAKSEHKAFKDAAKEILASIWGALVDKKNYVFALVALVGATILAVYGYRKFIAQKGEQKGEENEEK